MLNQRLHLRLPFLNPVVWLSPPKTKTIKKKFLGKGPMNSGVNVVNCDGRIQGGCGHHVAQLWPLLRLLRQRSTIDMGPRKGAIPVASFRGR